jgi:SAM-dependent methyltransferase
MADDREALRATFDSVAGRYDRARPEYPDAVFDVLLRQTGLRPGDRVLEVGCATGKATRPLAERGLRLTCVELGAELAAAARENLAGFPDVEVVNAAFETWRPPDGSTFDAVVAATAWHWADPKLRYTRAWELLRPGGHLAFWAAVHVRSSSSCRTSTTRSARAGSSRGRGRASCRTSGARSLRPASSGG